MKKVFLIISLFLFFFFPSASFAAPPFATSNKISSDIINVDDVTTYVEMTYEGVFERTVYDSRVNAWVTLDMFIFSTTYSDLPGTIIEFNVNLEFGSVEISRSEVAFYAHVVGQTPLVLRAGLDSVTLHKGDAVWTGGGGIISIHTEARSGLMIMNILEEIVVHEMVHAALDALYKDTDGWLQAQIDDDEFISVYASLHPNSEDMAESFLAYIALRTRFHRISVETASLIRDTIPARIAYFDSLSLNVQPLEFGFLINSGLSGAWCDCSINNGQGFYMEILPDRKLITLAWFTYDVERPPEGVTAILGEPGHRWVTALGPYVGNSAILKIYQTSGGVFDMPTPETVTPLEGDGTITIEFSSCTEGLVQYDITSIGMSGDISIGRIAHDNVSLCEALNPISN